MAPNAAQLPLHEHLRHHARATPDRTAYLWYGRAITWAELDAASDAFAARLQALGVKKGEPVALFMNNCPQYLMAHYGIQKIGAIVCPCGPLNKEHELEYQLNDLQARVIIAADVLLPVVDKVRGSTALQHVLAVRYCLCTALDEAANNTLWGSRGVWAGKSLLVTFHGESEGGIKLFQNPNDQIFKNTALDEVMFGPLQIGMSKKQAKEVALKALDMVGLKGAEKINPYELGYRDAFLSPEEFVAYKKANA